MAAKKGPQKKKEFDLDTFLEEEGFETKPNDKELSWIPLSKAWHDALKIPGFPRGFLSLIRGFSNTGKSTAFYEAIRGAQSIGDFPVVIETEGNWNWEHAKMIGVKCTEEVDEETGEIIYKPDGFMLVRNHDLYKKYKNYNHADSKMMSKPTRLEPVIEDVALFINHMLTAQSEGKFPRNLCFLWDSIGTLNGYQSATANGSNSMWNAKAMNCFQSIVNYKIPSSRDVESEFTNTFICVQKIWLDSMGMGQPKVKHKGGEFMFFNARIIAHVGGQQSHGTSKLKATSLGQEFQYGTQAKINLEKNHVTGIERKGVIASTPFGYVNPDELDEWKKEHRDFIHDSLNVAYDAEVEFIEEEGDFESGDIKE